jgi:hypothetical protein
MATRVLYYHWGILYGAVCTHKKIAYVGLPRVGNDSGLRLQNQTFAFNFDAKGAYISLSRVGSRERDKRGGV